MLTGQNRIVYRRQWYHKRMTFCKENKLCINCLRSNQTNTLRCVPCKKYATDTNNKRKQERKAMGLCPNCGTRVNDSKYVTCLDCRKLDRILCKKYRTKKSIWKRDKHSLGR